MPKTYEPIATSTLGSAAASITFSSIAGSWTDLRLILTGTNESTSGYIGLQFNGSTSGYNYIQMGGNGSGTGGGSVNLAESKMYVGSYGTASTTAAPGLKIIDIFSYAGSTTKTVLGISSAGLSNNNGSVVTQTGMWTGSSAITSIVISTYAGNLNTGFQATLYGILRA
jgi:hypothetical protein